MTTHFLCDQPGGRGQSREVLMRYLFGFLCVCALGLVPLVGCSETGGDGGTGGSTGDVFPCTEQGILDAIVQGGGPHTFGCDGPTTVTTGAEVVINSDVTLDGEGNLRVNADFRHRVFSVGEGATAELRGLEVTRGVDGAVTNLGTLTLTNTTVSESRGGGVVSGAGDPGGLGTELAATLTVTNSTVSRNSGAGIVSFGTLTVTNSTVSGNTGDESGGGEGIMYDGVLTLTSSTVSRNSGSAVSDMGGGSDAMVTQSLISGTCHLQNGGDHSNGYNIESPGDTCPFGHETDRVNVRPQDLHLGMLQDNGGMTQTHALGEDSIALDLIPEAMCEVNDDQRGVARPQGDGCDIGAFELEKDQPDMCHEGGFATPALYCPCTKICNEDTGECEEGTNAPQGEPCDGGLCDGAGNCVECYTDEHCGDDLNDCTEQRCDGAYGECVAFALANGTPCAGGTCQAGECALTSSVLPCTEQGIRNALAAGGGPYTFDCADPTVVTTTNTLEIRKDVILDGEGNLTVDGNQSHTVFAVGCVFNDPPVGGGAPCGGEGEAELRRMTIAGGIEGVDMHNEDVTFTLAHSTVSGNAGNGIESFGTFTVTNSTVSGNAGNGIESFGTFTVTNSTVSGNSGDGINNEGTLMLTNSTVSGNAEHGISNSGTAMLTYSLVDGDCTGSVTSNGYNIESPGNTCGLEPGGTDQVSVTAEQLNLGPLADNGRPTMTHALLTEPVVSVAIDWIPEAMCEVDEDQRGKPRPETGGSMCDVGSFERQSDDP